VDCHKTQTPSIVSDWHISKHSQNDVTCATCHGTAHSTAADAAKASIPNPDTCAACHEEKVAQFKKGKHAAAWAAMNAMPTIHWQPMALTDGMKGCGGCHKIGLKSEADVRALAKEGRGFGLASCDACHTRHVFSVKEASQAQACQTCHMGFDHPQWEMYSGSKHGVRHELAVTGVLPRSVSAPTCQTCHMPDGDHGVKTAWGFLGVRLPMPEDKEWAADRTTILEALGVLDVSGKPTARLEVMKAADVVRLTQQAWQDQRDKMVEVCDNCHAASYVKEELHNGDQLIRDADKLMAEAIRIIAALYKDGVLKKPKGATAAFPDLLTFHDAPTVIEQTLFVMFLEHRMRTYEGSFHQNPDYALWYGWSEMQRDLTEIRELAATMRRDAKKR